jgi:hypothetical protein
LCPQKKNLQAKLDNHLEGLKHFKIVEEAAWSGKTSASALSIACQGRPPTSTKVVTRGQQGLHEWFKVSNPTTSSHSQSIISGQQGSIFSLLYWGFRTKSVTYTKKWYSIGGLLSDSKSRSCWVPKPDITSKFYCNG